MPSADPGRPPVRPADVERWLAELGLEPVERADRDGIASWDLVLDGRRRFDLRVTVILDPRSRSSAGRTTPRRSTTCSASRTASSCAGTTSSRSPSSASARTSGRCSPSSSRSPSADARRAGPGARPHPRHRRPPARRVDGLAVARRPACPTRRPERDARGTTALRSARYAGAPARSLPERRREPSSPAMPALTRRARRSLVALALARRARPGSRRSADGREVRAAAPDLTIVSDARYDVQPDQAPRPRHARPDADEPPQGHEDQALLLRRGVPRRPARRVRRSS